MTQIHTNRSSDHPLIETVWQSQNLTDGVYVATPDGSWDLIVGVDVDGNKSMLLAGQATKPASIPYTAGTRSVVISFAAGAYLPHLGDDKLLDSWQILPNVDANHFELAGYTFAYPTFETVEGLVEEMMRAGVLKHDDTVDTVLKGIPKAQSKRAVQRHFVKTTGTTHKSLQQIQRAQEAVRLIKQGKRPIDAAIDAGYTDQQHLAKSIKRIMGTKPSDVGDIHKL